MHEHEATVLWSRDGAPFTDQRYSRVHSWHFDGGLKLRASASPAVVPLAFCDAAAIDPEEAFVASLASCHMLWFLWLAARRGLVVDSYRDEAHGVLDRDAEGQLALTQVVLRPQVSFAGLRLSHEELLGLHHAAHEQCFLARSVKAAIRCEPIEAAQPSEENHS